MKQLFLTEQQHSLEGEESASCQGWGRAHIAFDSDRALLTSNFSGHWDVTPFPTVLHLTHSEPANVFVKLLKGIWLQKITHHLPLQVLQSEERFILLVIGI